MLALEALQATSMTDLRPLSDASSLQGEEEPTLLT